EAYFDKLVAYIHLNPLRAVLVENLQQLADYPWSGHAVLMNKVRYDWMDRDYVLKFFGRTEDNFGTSINKTKSIFSFLYYERGCLFSSSTIMYYAERTAT
ncbi:MAG: hypothetical protein FDX30_06445, partial [Chlorobium sp.]